MLKNPASAVRSHRRSKSGGGSKDLETLDEDGVVILDPSSPGHDMSRYGELLVVDLVHGKWSTSLTTDYFNISSTPPRRRSSSSENEDTVNSIPSLDDIVKEMKAKE